jgi:murein DD-endopeptidase MepM/ murein hydrolase activator NlpD
MLYRVCFLLYRLRFVSSGVVVIIAALLVIAAIAPKPGTIHADNTTTSNMGDMGVSDSPNAVTAAMTTASYKISLTLDRIAQATGNGVSSAAFATSRTFSTIGHGIQYGTMATLRFTGHAAMVTLRGVGSGCIFVLRIPGHAIGSVAHAMTHGAVVNALIRPPDHNVVPIIDPNSPALVAAKQALPATPVAPLPNEAIWPLHGQITTQFGVPELPYQAIHTGLDISDGNYKGTTPIKAFRRGKVIDVQTTGGLGNHVVVDHGSGVTSVYGHLASITAQVGQIVDIDSVLGYEGSTGVSTGPHLHFEIRVNGQVTDPHQFINGQP